MNGDLFRGPLRTVAFSETMRELLLDATRLDWGQISPAIFGSLFQSVMDPAARRTQGAHYTSEQNILKALGPLLLDELRAELAHLRALAAGTNRTNRLRDLQSRLGALRLLDPACGCGNFLVVAYRELRLLEMEILEVFYPADEVIQFPLGPETEVRLNADQMHGIEVDEFPARIAEVALWLVDHQMNQRFSTRFGQYLARIPLRRGAHIVHANALQTDWNAVLPREQATHVVGNPPFVGAKMMTPPQRQELLAVAGRLENAGLLDYVAAWYLKAAQYTQGTAIRVAFVSTNSIMQGEQVGILWKGMLYDYKQYIHFAHQTFRWRNEGRRNAAVFCVIVGFGPQALSSPLRLFTYENPASKPQEQSADRINPYLVDASNAIIVRRQKPLNTSRIIHFGNMPLEGGNLLLTDEEKAALLFAEPAAAPFVRRFMGAEEFLHDIPRWCLWLNDIEPSVLRKLPHVLARVEGVRQWRLSSKAPSTQRFAATPTLFRDRKVPHQYLAIPGFSSENRDYIPIRFLTEEIIPGHKLYVVPEATLFEFGILTSAMHMSWMRYVGGRLKSDYSYSKEIVYNNFPWPTQPSEEARQAVEAAAQAVLAARAAHPGSTLADLYDPLAMPPGLRAAHRALDARVERLYRAKKFGHDTERVQHLFECYAALSAPLAPAATPAGPRRRGRASGGG